MRVNLIVHSVGAGGYGFKTLPVSVTIRPACGLPGDYVFQTDCGRLLSMLRRRTELASTVLDRMQENVLRSGQGRILGVSMSEGLLTELGYFIDDRAPGAEDDRAA